LCVRSRLCQRGEADEFVVIELERYAVAMPKSAASARATAAQASIVRLDVDLRPGNSGSGGPLGLAD
jgi:hypothetical protein